MADRNNIWGGSFEIRAAEGDDVECDNDRAASAALEEEVKQSWLLRPDIERERTRKKKKKFIINGMMVRTLAVLAVVVIIILIVVVMSRRHRRHPVPGPDNYTLALPLSLMFFNAQRCASLSLPSSFYLLICINEPTKFLLSSSLLASNLYCFVYLNYRLQMLIVRYIMPLY